MKPVLYLVIPCYNEEQVLPVTAPMFLSQMHTMCDHGLISPESKILFVNDGSKDKTWHIISDLAKAHKMILGMSATSPFPSTATDRMIFPPWRKW